VQQARHSRPDLGDESASAIEQAGASSPRGAPRGGRCAVEAGAIDVDVGTGFRLCHQRPVEEGSAGDANLAARGLNLRGARAPSAESPPASVVLDSVRSGDAAFCTRLLRSGDAACCSRLLRSADRCGQ
jgi:hypothetical protein